MVDRGVRAPVKSMVRTQKENNELNPILEKHRALIKHGLLGAEVWPVVAGKVDLGDIVIPKEVTTVLRFIGGVEIEIENICVVKDSHCSQRSSKASN